MNSGSMSYMMMFCAFLLARNRGISLTESLKVVPLSGGARALARDLVSGLLS